MADGGLFRTLARFVTWLTTLLQPVCALLTRLVLGEAFILTGLGKWKHFDNTVAFFDKVGIPAARANAAFVATLEIVGGACLILGLGTRIFSLLLSVTLIVALTTADRESFIAALDPSAEKGLMDLAALVFLMLLLWLAAFGPGPISADRMLQRKPEVRT
jgi:putative oxidoreductase